MTKEKRWKRIFAVLLFLLISFFLFANQVEAQIFLGTVDGYVRYALNGSAAPNFAVNITVTGCAGAGCSRTTTSDSGGYYAVANLNLEENQSVYVFANKTGYFGNATGTSDAFRSASVNITVARVPNPPSLVPQNDTHNNTFFSFEWTSGVDPDLLATYDIFILDGTQENNSVSPKNKTFLSFVVHNWSVVTCNTFGCSDISSDSFNVSNTPPPSPNLVDQNDTASNSITFNWTSGGADADGDSTFFVFDFDGAQQTTTPPVTVSPISAGLHTWKVQECDPYECSSFSIDTFTVTNEAPSVPTLTDQGSTDGSSVTLSWVSGVDPNNKTTYDDFQFNSDPVVNNATSPQIVSVTGIQYFTWRVRTCNVDGACSAYASDSFVKYTCPAGGAGAYAQDNDAHQTVAFFPAAPVEVPAEMTPAVPISERPSVITPPPRPKECRELWMCESWNPCLDDKAQSRKCVDMNSCGSKFYEPSQTRACTPDHCLDGIKSRNEEGLDCGGSCKPCVPKRFEFALSVPALSISLGVSIPFILLFFFLWKHGKKYKLLRLLKKTYRLLKEGKDAQANILFHHEVQPLYHKLENKLDPKHKRDKLILAYHREIVVYLAVHVLEHKQGDEKKLGSHLKIMLPEIEQQPIDKVLFEEFKTRYEKLRK
ncbi:hypothetical protein J4457_03250 [Candidatus Woesearchaeota archaeon]|nr:hypothetical protein [Candidatus Woesearchaeota archaeon]